MQTIIQKRFIKRLQSEKQNYELLNDKLKNFLKKGIMENVTDNCKSGGSATSTKMGRDDVRRRYVDRRSGYYEKCTNIGCSETDCEKFYNLFSRDSKIIPFEDFDLASFYHWFDQLHCSQKEIATVYNGKSRRYRIKFTTTGSNVMVILNGEGQSKKEQMYSFVRKLFGGVKQQMMEGNPESGLDNQDSVRATTTIITADTGVEETTSGILPDINLKKLCNSEDIFEMPALTDRFELFENGMITMGVDFNKTWVFPRDLFKIAQKKNSANLLLFRNFIYSDLELEFRIIINAPKFGQGRMIFSWYPDNHDELETKYSSRFSMIQRPHVFIDLNGVNQAVLTVPKIYRRTFIRNYAHESAVRGLPYSQLFALQMASFVQYTTGKDQPQSVPYTIEYRFVKLQMAGVSFGVELQMDGLVELAGDIFPQVKTAEKYLKRFGVIGNQDKPYDSNNVRIVPTPRMNFSSGSGISDAIPLQLDHLATVTTLTDYVNADDPKSVYDIARKWGIKAEFDWINDQETGTILHAIPVSPCYHEIGGDFYKSTPTPLDFVSSGYAFWRGTIEYEYQFVSTPFHTGSVQAQISYNRLGDDNYANANVYTKIFDLGMTTSFQITVPYIYDTPWRRCSSEVQIPTREIDFSVIPNLNWTGNQGTTKCIPFPIASCFVNNTKLTLRVMNKLIPIDNVASKVRVVLLIRAGKDFELRGIVPNLFVNPVDLTSLNFPSGRFEEQLPIYEDNAVTMNNIENGVQVPRYMVKYSLTNGAKTSAVKLQSDDDFSPGVPMKHFHCTENDTDIKTLLRRNYLLFEVTLRGSDSNKQVFGDAQAKIFADGNWNCWIPVKVPTHLNMGGRGSRCQATPISTLSTLFRHWRGSMRYTFIVKKSVGIEPVYISYAPNLGVKYVGHVFFPTKITKINDSTVDKLIGNYGGNPSELGWATEILLPQVNTSCSVSVPFDCMFNQCVNSTRFLYADGNNVNRMFAREDCTDFAGHIIIRGGAGVVLDVFVSVGDDFQMHNFVGTIEYNQPVVYNFPDSFYRYEAPTADEKGVEVNAEVHGTIFDKTKTMATINAEIKRRKQTPGHVTVKPDVAKIPNFSNDDRCFSTKDRCYTEAQLFSTKFENLCALNANATGCSEQIFDETKQTMKTIGAGLTEFVDVARTISGNIEMASTSLSSNVSTLTTNVASAAERLAGASENLELKVGSAAQNIEKTTSETAEAIKISTSNIEAVTREFGDNSKSIMQMLRPVLEKINSFLPDGTIDGKRIAEYTSDFVFDLIILVKDFNIPTFCIMIVKYIAKIFFVNFETIVEYSTKLAALLKRKLGSSSTQSKSEDQPGGSIFGFFVGLIASICKFNTQEDKEKYYYGSKFKDFIFEVKNVSYVNQVMNLIERVIKCLVGAIEWFTSRKEVEPTVKEYFAEHKEEVVTFMENVDEIMNPANRSILNRPDMKVKSFHTFLEAQAILKKTAVMVGNSAAGLLASYARKMMKFMEEQWAIFSCCPVRMEPRVICIEGESNIGKSFLVQHLGPMLLREIGWKALGQCPIFTRAPGRKHWDGYSDQPIILFDDWMNLKASEQVTEQLADLYELKSTCDFVPPKASLTEKGAKGNPKIIILLTNNAFPDAHLDGVAIHREAIYRRRDVMIKMRKAKNTTGRDLRAANATLDEPDFSYLEFAVVNNSTPTPDNQCDWVNFDTLYPQLAQDLKTYFIEEEQIARQKLNRFCRDLPPQIRAMADPIANFNYRVAAVTTGTQTGEDSIPSRKLARDIQELMEEVNKIYEPEMVKEPAREQSLGDKLCAFKNKIAPKLKPQWSDYALLPLREKEELVERVFLSQLMVELSQCGAGQMLGLTQEGCGAVAASIVEELAEKPSGDLAHWETRQRAITVIKKQYDRYNKYLADEEAGIQSGYKPWIDFERCKRTIGDILVRYSKQSICPEYCRTEVNNSDERDLDDYVTIEASINQFRFRMGTIENWEEIEIRVHGTTEWYNVFDIAVEDRDEMITIDVHCWLNAELLNIQDNEFAYLYPRRNGGELSTLKTLMDAFEMYDKNKGGNRKQNWTNFWRQMQKADKSRKKLLDEQARVRTEENKVDYEINRKVLQRELFILVIGPIVEDREDKYFELDVAAEEDELKYYHNVDKCVNGKLDYDSIRRLREKTERSVDFYIDSVVGHREYVEIRKETRKNFARSILAQCNSGAVVPGSNFRNVHVWNGITLRHFAQEQFDPCLNEAAYGSLMNCHHCRRPTIIQFGDDSHHVCHDCNDAETVCDYCAARPTLNKTIRWKAFWYVLRHGILLKKVGAFIKWIYDKIPDFIKHCFYAGMGLGVIGFTYIGGIVLGLRVFAGASEQAGDLFRPDVFDNMMQQRDNYVKNETCMHSMCGNLEDASYANYYWSIPNGPDDATGVSVYPCQRNCKLFSDADLMAAYKIQAMRFIGRQAPMITNVYDLAVREPSTTMTILGGVPPFGRLTHTSIRFGELPDLYNASLKKKYLQVWNKLYNSACQLINVNPTASKLKLLAKLGLGLVGIVCSIRGILTFCGYLKDKLLPRKEEQSVASYDGGAQRHFYQERQKVKATTLKNNGGTTTQSDNTYFESLYAKLMKNALNVRVVNRDTNVVRSEMLGVGLRNRYVAMPKHYHAAIKNYAGDEAYKILLVRPYYPEIEVEYKYDSVDFYDSDCSDLSIFVCPRTVNDFINITGYLARFEDFSGALPRKAIFFRGPMKRLPIPMTTAIDLTTKLEKKVELVDSCFQELQSVLSYNYSESGACGSMIMRTGNQRPIIGMHVAGTNPGALRTRGYAVILYREMLDHIVKSGDYVDNAANHLEDNVADAKMIFPDGVFLQCLAKSPNAVHIPSKTKIKPSLIHQYDGEPRTRPCYLSAREPGYKHEISPLLAGCMKHGKLTGNFQTSELLEVRDALYDGKYRSMKPSMLQPERLTIKQAITGLNVDGYESMKLDTSAGYPFIFEEKKQKIDYIHMSDEDDREKRSVAIREGCLQHVLEMEDLRKNGIRPMLPYVDEQKDARKELEKVEKLGATRIFCMSPLSTTIAGRQNFLHFAVAYKHNRLKLQHAVGISTDGPEWTQLANYLLSVGNNIITLDYSNFGPGYNAGVNACGHDIVVKWTKQYVGGVSDLEMAILGEEHFNSLHLMHDLIYRQLNGGPSGDCLTVVKNGLVNELYLLLAWRSLVDVNSVDGSLYGEFFEHVRLITYGDDAIISVSDKYCEQYNGITIAKFFAKYNIVATDAEKSGEMIKYRPLLECTFLKSGFKEHPRWKGEFLAPLNEISITETPRWIWASPDDGLATQFNADQGLRLAYGHGPKFFLEFREKLNIALAEIDLQPLTLTWEELDRNFFPKHYDK